MDALGEVIVGKPSGDVRLPELDWMLLPKDNIPTENPVEAIPQLEEQWKEEKKTSFLLIPGLKSVEAVSVEKKEDNSEDIINYTKKLMMKGIIGKELADKISEVFLIEDIKKVKDLLEELANEQGLLGKVYLDLSSFESCEEALRYLGKDRVKQVLFVIGTPFKKCCSTHSEGFCKILNKEVRKKLKFKDEDFDYYTKKLRVIGVLGNNEEIKSKEDLQRSLLKVKKPEKNEIKEKEILPEYGEEEIKEAIKKQVEKVSIEEKKEKEKEKFLRIRPILAYVQNLMLKGKYGEDLKELIRSKYSEKDLEECVEELKKIISLQGLLGNVYVDISFYKTPEEAIEAIKNSETSPLFVVQTFKENEYDDSLDKVCKATGCSVLSPDGKVDLEVIVSYLQDLLMGRKINKDQYEDLFKKALDSSSILVIKEAFDIAASTKKEPVIGGVKGFADTSLSSNKEKIDENVVKSKIDKAVKKGFSVKEIINKVANIIGSEKKADVLVKEVIANKKVISADVLSECIKENYNFVDNSTVIVPSKKCASCVFNVNYGCIKQQVKFASKKELKYFDFNEKEVEDVIKKVQLKENPDLEREDMKQEYDMSDPFGSGMNKALEKLRKK